MTPFILDTLVALVLAASTLMAYKRGIIREGFTILSLIASTVGTYKGGSFLIPAFNRWLDVQADGGEKAAEVVSQAATAEAGHTEAVQAAVHKVDLIFGVMSPAAAAKVGAYGATFILISLLMSLIGFFLSRGVQEAGMVFFDKLAGAGFGFVRGFLVVFLPYVLCLFLFSKDQENFPAWARNSITVPILQATYDFADRQFDLGQRIEDHGDSLSLKIGKIDPDAEDTPSEEGQMQQELSEEEVQERDAP